MSTDAAIRPDDRVLPATRWASLAIVLILLPALVVLWGFPSHTHDLWAWTFKPDMTAIFMGAGYGSGAFFFTRVYLSRNWHPAAAGVLSAAVFAAIELVVTFVHYDRFNHGDAPFLAAFAFYGWVIVYIVSPVGVGALWLANRRTDPGVQPGDRRVPAGARWAARAVAAGALIAAAIWLISPTTAIDVWPWKLTPLTARVLAGFVAQVGTGALLLSLDARWSAWRFLLETFLVRSLLAPALLALLGRLAAWPGRPGWTSSLAREA